MIHVAIVSHGHENLLINSQLGGLLASGTALKIWLKDNQPSADLKTYCEQHGVHYSDDLPGLGFGENNNFIFEQIRQEYGFQTGDYFVVMNPDLSTSAETILALTAQMTADACAVATIDLFKDPQYRVHDANIRHFPTYASLWNLVTARSLTDSYDKMAITDSRYVDWASGAFLVFDAAHYRQLGGFDQAYFMYFEDVDICYRSHQLLNQGVLYYPQFKAVHLAAHQNRNLISRHAFWLITSFLKFLSRRYFVYGVSKQISHLPLTK
ncbi:hypothetical protein LPB67_12545 [Undibacterium sp. Jales W-56]|uniref:hypothetical protein n=1 Tax=Undibacterium sp. Jales W-56 TaxID=2897325 RepID=UPI0021CF0285|nr:hypothetical protein [Undibacterium sp. Jales W-56]MCU6434601.1 hypothetical protein [Undibacterium sp. Jales W-56]